MANRWFDRLVHPKKMKTSDSGTSWIRSIVSGSLYRVSDIRGISTFEDIRSLINTMRALAADSQVDTALSYYATDATTMNTAGKIIWATGVDGASSNIAEIVNALFKRWKVNQYARDHILELATIGNLYIPTTYLYKDDSATFSRVGVVLDNNTISEPEFDIIPSYKIPPENIVHLWRRGEPKGYILDVDDTIDSSRFLDSLVLPEAACIHFSLGGLLGEYKLPTEDKEGNLVEYDIQFATPLLARAVQPTQTLGLLEDANVLSSLARVIKFINVDCGSQSEEIDSALQQVKDAIEQQLSLNTLSGDAQSYVNPQSPNNLIYLPKINGQDAISVTDLNMAEAQDADNKLLQYYQDKKLSVLGVPKEAMNFSSNEGLGGAGSVMSQRSAIYANSLQRLETAYIQGWTDAINKYFIARNMSGFVDKFELHMTPIETTQSTVQFEKRDAAISQAQSLVDLFKNIGITNSSEYRLALSEILSQVFPQIGAAASGWNLDIKSVGGDEGAF